jgi:putative MATE family efflux protein
MDKTKQLGEKPIGKLLASYSIPAVIAMLVNAIYNVVDRMFIGQYAGEAALAGLTVVFPIMMIIFAFASLIGTGGASLLAIRFGEKDEKGANHVFANTLSFGLIVTAITLIIIYVNLDGLLSIFGASADVLAYATTYMHIILGGFIFQMIGFILNSSVRTEGKPLLSMRAMIGSALTNIVLDYIFIAILGMGVTGAAYGTIIGQFVGLFMLVSYYLRGQSQLRLTIKDFIPDSKIISQIISIGFATFISTLGTSIAMSFINRSLGVYGGMAAITSMGAINSLYTFFIMPIMGITQGMQPIIGYNHGAKLRERVILTLKYGMGIGIGFSVFVFALLQLFPTTFVGLFLDPTSETMSIAINGLKIFIAMLPLLSINLMGVAYFQATAQGKISMWLGMLRQFIFLIPIVLVLPKYMGLNGVWLATPIADAFAILVTGIVLYRDIKGSGSGKTVVTSIG